MGESEDEVQLEESSSDTDYGNSVLPCFSEHDQDSEKQQDAEYEESSSSELPSNSNPEKDDDWDPQWKDFYKNFEEDDVWDSDWQTFFEKNVKHDGKSFWIEIPSSSGVKVYRLEESDSDEEEVERKITSKRDSRSLKAMVTEKKAEGVKMFSKIGEGSKNVVRGVPNKGRKRVFNVGEIREEDEDEDDCMPSKMKNCVIIDESHKKPLNSHAQRGRKAKALKKPSSSGGERSTNIERDFPCERAVNVMEIKEEDEDENHFIPCESSGEPSKNMNCVTRDKIYGKLLNSLSKNGRHPMEDGNSSDLEILASDSIPFVEGSYTPFVSSKCPLIDLESSEVIKNSSQSLFREKLTNLLKRPYDEKEFQSLWKEVTNRKPVERVRETRGKAIVYPTKVDGKSYLDWYTDLRVKIDEVRPDKRKILYLLRGFFFWLENTAHDGAFMPWSDSSYLKALR